MSDAESSPRRIPIHRALVKPQQILGCDRGLFFGVGALGILLVGPAGLVIGRVSTAIYGALLWWVGYRILVWMGKKDPWMRAVYIRSTRYRPKYPSVGRWDAKEPERMKW